MQIHVIYFLFYMSLSMQIYKYRIVFCLVILLCVFSLFVFSFNLFILRTHNCINIYKD